jgi:hypothetical protein
VFEVDGFFAQTALLLAENSLVDVSIHLLFEGSEIRFAYTERAPVEELASTLKSLRPWGHFTVKTLTLPAKEVRARAEELRSFRVPDAGQQSRAADQAEP